MSAAAPLHDQASAAANEDAAERAAAARLAGLPRMTTPRLWALRRTGSWRRGWAIAVGDETPTPATQAIFDRSNDLPASWRAHRRTRASQELPDRCAELEVQVVLSGDPHYPQQLVGDPSAPPVLFARGSLDALAGRRVGVIGTRNATQRGRQTAARFGFELAAAGVAVVSGLARGIDGAAHRGALGVPTQGVPKGASPTGRPVAVVANGLDTPYPRSNANVWEAVAERGLLLSEWPPGTVPDAWRFPLRNRIIAALSEVLVVVESRETGGSLITANEAAQRGAQVFAVPGPIDARAAAGTNALLRDGAAPALDTGELLLALGLDHRHAGQRRSDARTPPTGLEAAVLDLLQAVPADLDRIVAALGLPLTACALAVARLESAGWVRETAGWFEPVDEWSAVADGSAVPLASRPDPGSQLGSSSGI